MTRPTPVEELFNHSFRCSGPVWAQARERAAREKISMSSVVADLVAGYGEGAYDLPKKKVVRDFG